MEEAIFWLLVIIINILVISIIYREKKALTICGVCFGKGRVCKEVKHDPKLGKVEKFECCNHCDGIGILYKTIRRSEWL